MTRGAEEQGEAASAAALRLVPIAPGDLPLLERLARAYCVEDGHAFHEDRQPPALAALAADEPLGRAWLSDWTSGRSAMRS